MARKKEPQLMEVNQKKIADVAKILFHKNGIEGTRMDVIAQKADISKSTLYVYFRSKEEIEDYITLEAMGYLYENFAREIQEKINPHEIFMGICNFLVRFREEYPFSFQVIVKEICIDENILRENPFLRDIYETGERINQLFCSYLGTVREDLDENEIRRLTFSMWGSIYGVIELADNKKKYIQMSMGMSKQQFLEQSFEELYKIVERV